MVNVTTKVYSPPPFLQKEARRYAGIRGASDECETLIEKAYGELSGEITYKVCYKEFPVTIKGDVCDFSEFSVVSATLSRTLAECESAIIFIATIGLSADRIISKYTRTSPALALILDAVGTERIEALCDAFNNDIREAYPSITRRFSPGYSDLPLEMQTNIFKSLNPERHIGVFLSDTLLMSPMKSVSAIIGIKKNNVTRVTM